MQTPGELKQAFIEQAADQLIVDPRYAHLDGEQLNAFYDWGFAKLTHFKGTDSRPSEDDVSTLFEHWHASVFPLAA